MIVLSAGMQKSGTDWYYNMTNDLLVTAGYEDARAIRQKYRLESVLKHSNCQLANAHPVTLLRLMVPHFTGQSFVVKTHSRPSTYVRRLMRLGVMRATYIYRDPRDVVLSALDHGEKIRQQGERHTFAHLEAVEDSILYVKGLLKIWDDWMQTDHTLFVRYEDLKANPFHELHRLAEHLRLRVTEAQVHAITDRYHSDRLDDEDVKGSLHFNKAVTGRYKTHMSEYDLALCNEHFGSYLMQMGYN
jgi:hypothetical protein